MYRYTVQKMGSVVKMCLYRTMLSIIVVLFLVLSTSYSADITLKSDYIFENYNSTFDIKAICRKYLVDTTADVSDDCKKQLNIVCQNETVLLTMLDSASKFPYAGILASTKSDNGNFDECIRIDHTEQIEDSTENVRVLGKHCMAGFILAIPSSTGVDIFNLATCIPDKCNADDLISITQYQLFSDVGCTTKDGVEYTTGDKIIIAIFGICGIIVLISTIYDTFIHEFELRPLNDVLVAFSLLTNGKKLFQTLKKNKEQISVFDGLRFFSMCWVIAVHSYGTWTQSPVLNGDAPEEFFNSYYSLYVSSGAWSVDTFFYMSGFLFAYQYFKGETKPAGQQIKQVPWLYVHRYIRLTPALLMVYLFAIGIIPHIISGPAIPMAMQTLNGPCYDHWWSLFLYFQNYYSPEQMCMIPTWYICADMQMFLLAPLVAIPVSFYLKQNFKKTMIGLLCLNIFLTLLPFIYIIGPSIYRNGYATDLRLVDYGIGFMMGAFMRERKHMPFKFNKIINLLLWIICITLLVGSHLILRAVEMHSSDDGQLIYTAFMRPILCISLSWIVYSCYHNRGGIVNWILTLSSFQVASRLTYSMYLLHVPFMTVRIMQNVKTKRFFNDFNAIYEWCGVFLTTFFLAIVWVLAFESPMMAIEKFIFGGKDTKKSNKAKSDVENVPEETKNLQ